MKRIALAVLFALSAVAFSASCACIPREWCMRNGLTDEQIDGMFGRFKDPNFSVRITRETWNNIKFNTHRYNNVTNWLAVIGRTNDYARLVVPTMATNNVLKAEVGILSRLNSVLRTENGTLSNLISVLRTEIEVLKRRRGYAQGGEGGREVRKEGLKELREMDK